LRSAADIPASKDDKIAHETRKAALQIFEMIPALGEHDR
jgi:hypothetical protein